MSRELLEQAYAKEEEYLALLGELVERESPTSDKAACDALADRLVELLDANGFTTTRSERSEVGDIVTGQLERGAAAGPRTLLLCHYDTVWPVGTLAEMPFKREGDKLMGPGVLDMKAGIVNALLATGLAAARTEANGAGLAVTLLLTSDEEMGSGESRELIEALAKEHDRVLVLEPGREDGALKTGRKGVGGFTLRLRGRSAHAGNNPAAGASALRELAHLLLYVEDLGDDVAGTSVNVTTARAGFASNVIAEEATATVDLRVLKSSGAERVAAALKEYVPRDERVSLTVTGGLNRPPMELTVGNQRLFETATGVLASMGLALEGAVVGGGSDGNFTSHMGVPTLDGLGAVGDGAHARSEHIRIRESLERMALVAGLLTSP